MSKSEQIGELVDIDLNSINEKFRTIQRLIDGMLETFGDEYLSEYLKSVAHDNTNVHTLGDIVPHDNLINLNDIIISTLKGNSGKVLAVNDDEESLVLSNSFNRLATETVDLQNGDSKSNIYIVPENQRLIPLYVIIHSPSGSLDGGYDYSLGTGTDADTWDTQINLSTLTGAIILTKNNLDISIESEGSIFGILPVIGSTADVTATAELYGILF